MSQDFFVSYRICVKSTGQVIAEGSTTCTLLEYREDTFLSDVTAYVKAKSKEAMKSQSFGEDDITVVINSFDVIPKEETRHYSHLSLFDRIIIGGLLQSIYFSAADMDSTYLLRIFIVTISYFSWLVVPEILNKKE